jgi:hypothetical protein
LEFAFAEAVSDGGSTQIAVGFGGFATNPPPALIDASQYSGIEFWLWVSPSTVEQLASAFEVCLLDRWHTNGFVSDRGCEANAQRATACDGACASISQSVAAVSQGAGPLLDDRGGVLTTLSPGWQLVKVPWDSFSLDPYYGAPVESAVDPTSLTFLWIGLQQDRAPDAGAAPIAFDFCFYDLAFYGSQLSGHLPPAAQQPGLPLRPALH